jgi:hypothetical protein
MSWSAMAGSSCSLSGLRVLPSRARSFDGQVACRPRDGEKSSMTVQSVGCPFKFSVAPQARTGHTIRDDLRPLQPACESDLKPLKKLITHTFPELFLRPVEAVWARFAPLKHAAGVAPGRGPGPGTPEPHTTGEI